MWLQTPTAFWLGGGTISLSYNIGHIEIPTAQPLMPEPSAFEVEMAIEKLKKTNNQVLIKSWQN